MITRRRWQRSSDRKQRFIAASSARRFTSRIPCNSRKATPCATSNAAWKRRNFMPQNEWIYDWNTTTPPQIRPGTRVLLDDETLRDGLQNPSVFDPCIDDKIEILHLMES